jgi:hypothetical protein
MQDSHAIYVAMFQYAIDHDSGYPTGKSSTEAFQKLLDGGYVSDPALFCLPLHGKYPAKLGAKLKPENVTWDLTADISLNGKDDNIPLVFSTGYRIEYKSGGRAVPLGSLPVYVYRARTWTEWWDNRPRANNDPSPGLAVAYHSGLSRFIKAPDPATGIVPNVIPADTSLGGKTYRQLTPDGELPP